MAKQRDIRHTERISVLQEAEIRSGEKKYAGIIEDFSTTGLNLVIATEVPDSTFIPGARFTVKFKSSDKYVQVQCEACWIRIDSNPSHGLTYRIALEIVERSEVYLAFLKTLS